MESHNHNKKVMQPLLDHKDIKHNSNCLLHYTKIPMCEWNK